MEKNWNKGWGLDLEKKRKKLPGETLTRLNGGGSSYAEGRDSVQGPSMFYAAGLQGGGYSPAEPKKETTENDPVTSAEQEISPYLKGKDQVKEPELPYGAGPQAWGYPQPQEADTTPTGPKVGTAVAPYLTGKDQVKEPELPYGAGLQAGLKPQGPVEEEESGHWLKKIMPPRTSLEVREELEPLEGERDDLLREAETWESQAMIQETLEEMSRWEEKGRELREKAAELDRRIKTLQKEWEYAMNWEWEEEKKRMGYRDPTFRDLTVGSFQQAYDTAQFGKESYRDMLGDEDNRKEEYEEKLAGDEYKFMPEEWWEKVLSGTSAWAGEELNKAASPETVAAVGSFGSAAAWMGQAGLQAAIPEEVITFPVAIAAGYKAGTTATNIKIQTGLIYDELLKNGVSQETAQPIAEAVGGAAGLMDLIPVNSLIESLGILQKSGVSQKAIETILDELKRRGIVVAGETLLDTAQEGLAIAGVQAGTKMDTGEWAYSTDQVIDRLGDTAVDSLLTNSVEEVIGGVKDRIIDAGHGSGKGKTSWISDEAALKMSEDWRSVDYLLRKGKVKITRKMSPAQKIAAVRTGIANIIREQKKTIKKSE